MACTAALDAQLIGGWADFAAGKQKRWPSALIGISERLLPRIDHEAGDFELAVFQSAIKILEVCSGLISPTAGQEVGVAAGWVKINRCWRSQSGFGSMDSRIMNC